MSQGSMSERALGADGLKVSAIGLGSMGMIEFYDSKLMDDAESIKVIHRYFDAGGNFLDTADMYGSGRNETLVGPRLPDAATRSSWRRSSPTSVGLMASFSAFAATPSM